MPAARLTVLFALLLGTVGCDRGTKVLAAMSLRDRAPIEYLDGAVRLLYAENTGGFGSLGATWPWALRVLVLSVVPALFLLGLLIQTLRGPRDQSWKWIVAVALVVGGGAGNLIDRALQGYVIDFMYVGVGRIGTNVFNVADVALMVGLGLMLLDSRKKPAAPAEAPAPPPDAAG